jgi:hypothetical protein
MFLGSRALPGRDNLTPSVSRLSRQCDILNISRPYRTPKPVAGIALLIFFFTLNSSITYYTVVLAENSEIHNLTLLPSYEQCS